jgi:hypothetical protein
VRFVLVVLFAALVPASFVACDASTPGPEPSAEGGTTVDGAAPAPPLDDGAIVAPIPFDAGTTPAPTCKGLFELCSGQECCSPNLCTNGTCR